MDEPKVEVRVTDLYELVRHYYGGGRSARAALAADRCNVALCGVPRIDEVLKQYASDRP